MVDLGEGKAGGAEGGIVVNAVEDGDEVEKAGEEAGDLLEADGLGEVAFGMRDLFCEMGKAVGGADSVGAVEHAEEEDKAVWVADIGLPFAPDKVR